MDGEFSEKNPLPVLFVPRNSVCKQESNGQMMISMPHGVELHTEDVQEVVVVTGVEGEEIVSESVFDEGESSYQSGTEIAAVEEVCGEHKNRLELMLAAVEGAQEATEQKLYSPKKLYFSKSRRGRQKRRWGTKPSLRVYKRQYLESESSDVKDDPTYEDYDDKDSYGRLMRREAKKRLFAHRYV